MGRLELGRRRRGVAGGSGVFFGNETQMSVQDSTAWSGCSNSAEPSATNAPSTVAAIPVRYAAVDVLDPTRLTRLAT